MRSGLLRLRAQEFDEKKGKISRIIIVINNNNIIIIVVGMFRGPFDVVVKIKTDDDGQLMIKGIK